LRVRANSSNRNGHVMLDLERNELSPEGPPQPAGKTSLRRLALPAVIAIGLMWLLAGCGLGIYLPIPEHVQAGKTDFRGMVGDAQSSRPIRPLKTTRAGVRALLGEPDYQTADGKTRSDQRGG